jgi:ABC-type branched-subunit amino acid transport system ATPase component
VSDCDERGTSEKRKRTNNAVSALLRLDDLDVGYRGRVVVHGIRLELSGGQILGLLGRNGSGKSTTLKTILGTVPAMGGRIRLGGGDVTGWRTPSRVRAGIGFSPEGRRVFPGLSVEANLLVGARTLPRRLERDGLERAFDLFPELRPRARQRAGTLSGGEQQMLAIARALMSQPRVLLVEEPSAGLAPRLVDRVYAGLREIAASGVGILIAEQFQQLHVADCDDVLVIDAGTVRPARITISIAADGAAS